MKLPEKRVLPVESGPCTAMRTMTVVVSLYTQLCPDFTASVMWIASHAPSFTYRAPSGMTAGTERGRQ